jgi:hypothetical protein
MTASEDAAAETANDNKNDAAIILTVKNALLARGGEPTVSRRARLTWWCHRDSPAYKRGVPIGEAICLALYGRIVRRGNS